jgi:hypothetical protein
MRCSAWALTRNLSQGLASRLHKSATLKRLAIYYDPSVRSTVFTRMA